MTSCPTPQVLEQFLQDELPAKEREVLELHVEACPSCQQALDRLSRGVVPQEDPERTAMHKPPPDPAVQDGGDREEVFLQKVKDHPPGAAGPSPPVSPGTRVGPYKLLQEIGHGGMGTVWMAEQQQPLRRQVAVKVIKAGMDSHQVLARFEQERQALALMDHPNIAKVLDAGTTEHGLPFFVMELVKGLPITDYCDQHQLAPAERLALFGSVCQALQHAHQKGIIHRDIKPSNVLVARYDGRPVVKVIDFGVAKAVGQQLTERTLFTGFGGIVGTLEYMSPEQAEFNALDVDTRSDIYSLGVLLYELLTGTTPLSRQQLQQAALSEILRLIREEEPPRPSTRLSESKEALPILSARRQLEPAQLTRLVRGELDWIVMKALDKDRSRRYETASSFAADVQRYLRDEPVEAGPPSAAYRFRKFARRHKRLLRTIAGFAGLLIVAVIVSTTLAVWTALAEQEAWKQRDAADTAREAEKLAATKATLAKDDAEQQRDQAHDNLYVAKVNLVQRAYEQNHIQRMIDLLESLKPTPASPKDRRQFEWHYLWRLAHPGLELGALEDAGYTVAFHPGGKYLAADCGANGMVKVWDLTTGAAAMAWKAHSDPVTSIAYSPDGRRLVTASGGNHGPGQVKVWDAATGTELLSVLGPGQKAASPLLSLFTSHAVFSPDGQSIAAAGADGTVTVRDAVTGKEILSLPGGAVAFSPDGKYLATPGPSADQNKGFIAIWDTTTGKEVRTIPGAVRNNGSVTIWDARTGKAVRTLMGAAQEIGVAHALAFSPDGQLLAASLTPYGGVIAWHLSTGKIFFLATGKHGAGTPPISGIAFSPDSQRLAALSPDNTLAVWEVTTGKEILSLRCLRNSLLGVAFSPDGRSLAATDAAQIRVCELAAQEVQTLGPVSYTPATEEPISFTADSRFLAAADKVWESAGNQLVHAAGQGNEVTLSPDGRHFAVRGPLGRVEIRSLKDIPGSKPGQLVRAWRANATQVISLVYSPDGRRLATCGIDNVVKVWQADTGQETLAVAGSGTMHFSRDGRRLVVTDAVKPHWMSFAKAMSWKLWDLPSGREVRDLSGPGLTWQPPFSPDGKFLVSPGNSEAPLTFWDAATDEPVLSIRGEAMATFSPNGRHLAAYGTTAGVKLWDLTGRRQVGTLPLVATYGAFSPDNKHLALTITLQDPGVLSVWDWAKGQQVFRIAGYHGKTSGFAFSPDGQRLAVTMVDGSVKIWETASGQELLSLTRPHERLYMGLAFSPDGQKLAAQATDGTVRIWDATPPAQEQLRQLRHTIQVQDLFVKLEDLRAPLPGSSLLSPPECRELLALAERQAQDLQRRRLQALENGRAYLRRHQWDKAAPEFTKAIALIPDGADHDLWNKTAALLAQAGDQEGYRRHRQEMLKRFGSTLDPVIAERTAKACLLLPGTVAEVDLAAQLADRALRQGPRHWGHSYFELARSLADYRQGRFQSAEARLSKIVSGQGDWNLLVPANLVLAMTQHRLGRGHQARQALSTASSLLDKQTFHAESDNDNWHDWLIGQVLRREAETLLGRLAD